MAPIYTALGTWAAAGLPGATVFSLIILFILTIIVLALCTRCQKHSFDLQHDPPRERNSTLIRIVQLENVAVAVDNPGAADITRDEKDLGSLPGNGAVKPAGQQEPTTWRMHTIDRNPERTINGDSNHNIIQRPDPAVTEPPVVGTSLRTVDQTVLTYTEITSLTDRAVTDSELPDFQTVSLEDQTEDTSRDLSSTLQVPHEPPQHMYETIGEVSVSADQSEMTLNPYAMYESIMTNSIGNGSNLPAPPVLAEEPGEDMGGRNINDTYARVSKKIKQSSPPLEEPAENMYEDGAPPYPETS